MVDINAILKIRADDIMAICDNLGAQSVVDVGSNLGGFLYYLEKFSDRSRLLGIEGDKRFVAECKKVSGLLQSQVQFLQKPVMSVPPMEQFYDAMILQNVYHYIYDKTGSHEAIFRKFAEIARSIISYNPMSKHDPVIGAHANSNPDTDWERYTHKDIFEGAIKAGFLHAIPDKISHFNGMGPMREHWKFVRDDLQPIKIKTIALSDVSGEEVDIREYYREIHSVRLDATRSYKVFKPRFRNRLKGMIAAVEKGVLDETLCPDLQFIADENGEIAGYTQPRGLDLLASKSARDFSELNRRYHLQQWRLLSRMLRHDMFNHDIGAHNFVVVPGRADPMFVDLEGFVQNASEGLTLSINRLAPTSNEVTSAENNMNLLFPDLDVRINGRDPISVLWDALHKSNFLAGIDCTDILAK